MATPLGSPNGEEKQVYVDDVDRHMPMSSLLLLLLL